MEKQFFIEKRKKRGKKPTNRVSKQKRPQVQRKMVIERIIWAVSLVGGISLVYKQLLLLFS